MHIADLIAPPICVACGGWAGRAEPLCGGCRRLLVWQAARPVELARGLLAWAPLAYDGPARAVVVALKFRGARAVADAMAAPICAGAPPGWLERATLVPVPLHPARRRRRGFNQAERLARAIAARSGLPVSDCLTRAGPRTTQMGSGRSARLALRTAIHAREPPPGPLVLIDDVTTTGATLRACAVALRAAGARDLRAIAYTRTPGR